METFPFLKKKRKRETMKNQKATFTISESTQLRRQNTTTKQAMIPTTTPKPPKGSAIGEWRFYASKSR